MAEDKLYLFQCENSHRLYSKDTDAKSCLMCAEPKPMKFIATLPRREGESESEHKVRALAWGRKK